MACTVAVLAAGAVMPAAVRAQLAVNRVELTMHSANRAERDAVIGVRNSGAEAIQAVLRLEDWDRTSDGTNRWFEYGSQPGSCGKALSIFPMSTRLEAGASQNIRLTLDSLAAIPQECWGAVVVENRRPGVASGQQVEYVLRTAVKVYVLPNGLTRDGAIAAMHLVDDAADAHGPAAAPQFELEFRNTGGEHVTARGTLEFRRADNSVAARVALPDVYALPGARHTVRVAVPSLPRGRYVALAMLDYGGAEIAAAQVEYESP